MCVVSTMFVIVVDLMVDLRLIWSEFSRNWLRDCDG